MSLDAVSITAPPRSRWTVAPAAFLLSITVIGASFLLWKTGYEAQPLWVEHAAYGMWANVVFHDALTSSGYWPAFLQALHGARHVLQPSALALISARLLSWPHAHLLITGLTLYLFLDLLARCVYQRCGSAAVAIGACALFCTFVGLYDSGGGMGAPWPDYQSMFLLGSAVLALALFAMSERWLWLVLAGTYASLAALARDTGSVYAAVTTAPAVALLIVRALWRRQGILRAVTIAFLVAIPAAGAMWMLWSRIPFFQQYYMTSNAWQLRFPLQSSAASVIRQVIAFCGVLPSLMMVVMLIGGLVARRPREITMADAIVAIWPLAFFSLLVANGYTTTGTKEVMYIAPGALAAIVMIGGVQMSSGTRRIVFFCGIALCAAGAARTYAENLLKVGAPTSKAIALRDSQRALAATLAAIPRRVSWQSYSAYDWATVVAALTFYEFGRYQPSESNAFFNKKNYWDAHYPGMDLSTLEQHLVEQANREFDVVVVLKDPDHQPDGMEPYSFSIAAFVAKQISVDPEWMPYRDVPVSGSEVLALYVNRRRMTKTEASSEARPIPL